MNRILVLAFVVVTAACAPDPTEECRAFSRALCERTVACDDTDTQTACLQRVDSELRCADVFDTSGDPQECTTDIATLECSDIDAQRLPPSCDDVKFVGP